jgi:hypothetical protein
MPKRIDKDLFVQTWTDMVLAGAAAKDVAAKLNMTPESAAVKASVLRKKGVNLPYPSKQKVNTVKEGDVTP